MVFGDSTAKDFSNTGRRNGSGSLQRSPVSSATHSLRVAINGSWGAYGFQSNTFIAPGTLSGPFLRPQSRGQCFPLLSSLALFLDNGSNEKLIKDYVAGGVFRANTWTRVVIPIADVNHLNKAYNRLIFRNTSDKYPFTFFVDNVVLVAPTAAPVPGPTPAPTRPAKFVQVVNGGMVLEGAPFRFAGTNAYYLAQYENFDPYYVDLSLNSMKARGINAIRPWGFREDGNCRPVGSDPVFQMAPVKNADGSFTGVYNEAGLQKLDSVIAKAKQRGIRVILTFSNYWHHLGGICQYLKWVGHSPAQLRGQYPAAGN